MEKKPISWYIEDWILFLKDWFSEMLVEINKALRTKSFWIFFLLVIFVYLIFRLKIEGTKFLFILFLITVILFFYIQKIKSGGAYRHKHKQKQLERYRKKAMEKKE